MVLQRRLQINHKSPQNTTSDGKQAERNLSKKWTTSSSRFMNTGASSVPCPSSACLEQGMDWLSPVCTFELYIHLSQLWVPPGFSGAARPLLWGPPGITNWGENSTTLVFCRWAAVQMYKHTPRGAVPWEIQQWLFQKQDSGENPCRNVQGLRDG